MGVKRICLPFFWCFIFFMLAACDGDEYAGPAVMDPIVVSEPAIISLQITPAQTFIPVGFEQQLIAQAIMSDGSVQDMTRDPRLSWHSKGSTTATVDAKGLAKGLTPGTVEITAVGMGADCVEVSTSIKLSITSTAMTGLRIFPERVALPIGLEHQLAATATLSDGAMLDVTQAAMLRWSSSDPSIAIVAPAGSKGLVTGMARGSAIITASSMVNGSLFSTNIEVMVTDATVTSFQVSPVTGALPIGLEQKLVATATLSDGSILDVTQAAALSWSSSDPSIATVTSVGSTDKGLVTGESVGTTTITAAGTVNGSSFIGTTEILVTDATEISLQIFPSISILPAGMTQRLIATATLSDGGQLNITDSAALHWSSSDPTIATVSSLGSSGKGLVTSITTGTTTIIASGISASGVSFNASALLTVQ